MKRPGATRRVTGTVPRTARARRRRPGERANRRPSRCEDPGAGLARRRRGRKPPAHREVRRRRATAASHPGGRRPRRNASRRAAGWRPLPGSPGNPVREACGGEMARHPLGLVGPEAHVVGDAERRPAQAPGEEREAHFEAAARAGPVHLHEHVVRQVDQQVAELRPGGARRPPTSSTHLRMSRNRSSGGGRRSEPSRPGRSSRLEAAPPRHSPSSPPGSAPGLGPPASSRPTPAGIENRPNRHRRPAGRGRRARQEPDPAGRMRPRRSRAPEAISSRAPAVRSPERPSRRPSCSATMVWRSLRCNCGFSR